MQINHFSELRVYQGAQESAGRIYTLSQGWPADERFALTGQTRRSSRSVGANLAESWGKRRYEAHFVSKLTDADGENHETEHWLMCARDCGYLDDQQFTGLVSEKLNIGKMLGAMLQNPHPFLLK